MRGGGTPAAAHFPEVLVAAFAVIPPPAPKSVFSTGVVPRAKRKRNPGSEFSVAQYLEHFEKSKPPARKQSDSSAKARRRKLHSDMVMVQTEKWLARDKFDPKCTADARNTLFVSRLNYKTTEDELRRHMQEYGSIKDLKLVCTLDGKPRGYAFVEMETNADFARAHRGANMTILNGARICVDVERGRTMKDWKPRRLGGGVGPGRRQKRRKKGSLTIHARRH